MKTDGNISPIIVTPVKKDPIDRNPGIPWPPPGNIDPPRLPVIPPGVVDPIIPPREPIIIDPGYPPAAVELIPRKDVTFVPEDSMVVRGYPTVPRYWVRARTMASVDGSFYSSERPNATEVETGAYSRFMAHTFDNQSGVWRPFYSDGIDYYFQSPPGLAPLLETTQYRIKKEVFNVPALRFEPGDYLNSFFNQNMDDAVEFSVVMVLAPEVPLDYTIFATQNQEEEIAVHLDGQYQLSYGGVTSSLVGRNISPAQMVPTYLVLTSDGIKATLFIASSSRNIQSVTVRNRSNSMHKLAFTVGKTHRAKARASMHLIEFLVYNTDLSNVRERAFTEEEANFIPPGIVDPIRPPGTKQMTVADVIGKLSGIYGAS